MPELYPLSWQTLEGKIKKDGISGSFLFYGQEEFLKEYMLGVFREKILTADGFEVFNHIKISLSDGDLSKLNTLFSASPVGQDCILVEIRDFTLLSPNGKNELKKADSDTLFSILEKLKSYPEIIAVFYCRESELLSDNRETKSALYKRLSEHITPVRFDIQQLPKLKKWISARFTREKIKISEENAEFLASFCSFSMTNLKNEIDKLILYAKFNNLAEISTENIKNVAVEYKTDDPFYLADAIRRASDRDMKKYVSACIAKNEEPLSILAAFAREISNMYAVFAGDSAKKSPFEIASKLGLKEYPVKLYLAAKKCFDI